VKHQRSNVILRTLVWLGALSLWIYLKKPAGSSLLPLRLDAGSAIGIALVLVGVAVYVWASLALATAVPSALAAPVVLLIRGPYGYVRNPLYLAAGAVFIGTATIYAPWRIRDLISIGIVAILVHFFVVRREEVETRKRLGLAYDQYFAEVPRWIPTMRRRTTMLERIVDGPTDLVFDYVAQGQAATAKDRDGTPLIRWCAYHGDVSAIRFLLANGESRQSLGENLDLNGAAFHGHWQLCQFLIENGADVNRPLVDTGESPLHAALCKANRPVYDHIVEILLANGANPNAITKASAETGGFMRDCRTRAETPLHRAAAFGSERSIQRLLDAGAIRDTKDMNGDTPLTWASWHLRPPSVLRKLCYGDFSVNPGNTSTYDHGVGWEQPS